MSIFSGIFLICILLVFLAYFIYKIYDEFISSLWFIYFSFVGMEYCETSKSAMRDIGKIIRKYYPEKCDFYDLGSSRGALISFVSNTVPYCIFHGIENITFQIRFSRLFTFFHRNKKNIHFVQSDFRKIDISQADILYLYIPQKEVGIMEKKLKREMNKSQIVILYRISFPNWKPASVIPTDIKQGKSRSSIFIYKV